MMENNPRNCYTRVKYKGEIKYVALPYGNINSDLFIKNGKIRGPKLRPMYDYMCIVLQ